MTVPRPSSLRFLIQQQTVVSRLWLWMVADPAMRRYVMSDPGYCTVILTVVEVVIVEFAESVPVTENA